VAAARRGDIATFVGELEVEGGQDKRDTGCL